MKKKIVSLLLAFMLVLPPIPSAGVQAAGSLRGDLYRLINQERTKAGLSSLNASSYLNGCSVVRIGELFQSFSHTRPDGRDWRTVLEDKNLPVDVAYSGEIICAGQTSAAEALNAFMNSPDHRAILMDSGFNFMGVGHGVQNGADYWVVNFTRSNQLQPENDCFDSDTGDDTPPATGNVNLIVYYGDVATKDGKVLLSEESPDLKCWLHAPRGSYFQSWSVTVADQGKEPIYYSGECPEEQTLNSERKALSLMMWKEPENGALVYPTCRLEPGKDYYYKFEAVVNGRTYSSQYIPFLVDGESVEPVTLTLTEQPGSDGAVLVNGDNPALHATLKAPIGSKITYSMSIYPLNSAAPIAVVDNSRTGTVSKIPATIGFTIWKAPVGNKITYPDFSLTLGETYRYEFTATVDGAAYTTDKGRFRLPASEAETYTVTFFNPINGTSSTKTVTNGQPYGALPTPAEVSGYKFEGWYADTGLTQRVTKDTIVNLTKDQTLYARMVREQEDKPVSLTLKNKTGLSGVQDVYYSSGRFDAILSAPKGKTITGYSFNVYTTGGSRLGGIAESVNTTTNGGDYNPYYILGKVTGTVNTGTSVDYHDFKLTVGTTYMYEFTATVDGQTYSTGRSRFRLTTSSSSGTGFSDVKPGSFCADPVIWAVDNGITTGVGGGRFAPGDACKREQIVTFLYRSKGSPAVSITDRFTDMPKSEEFQRAISWAVESGITMGNGKGKFNTGMGCTRAEAVTFLWRAAGKPVPSRTYSFSDMPENPDFKTAISWAVENDITQGTGGNKFSPGRTCTRGEIVTFLYRAR